MEGKDGPPQRELVAMAEPEELDGAAVQQQGIARIGGLDFIGVGHGADGGIAQAPALSLKR